MDNDAKLSISDADCVARWFLYRAGPDERRLLMADMPQVYARMFPGVSRELITEQVSSMIGMNRDNF